MSLVKRYIKKYSHFLILLYYIVILYGYSYLNATTVPKYFMYTVLDDYIPFVPIMVIPYLLWYPYIALAIGYLGFTNKKDFCQLCLFLFAGMTLSYVIFFLYPNGQTLRPHFTESGILSSLINMIYSADKPTNSAPSMHVIDSVAVFFALYKNKQLKDNKIVQFLSGSLAILIILSTVMIKQHSVLDLFYGLVMSIVLYGIVYKLEEAYQYVSQHGWKDTGLSVDRVVN